MIIPGILISIVTFPGVIIHELSHKLFCQLTGVKVEKVCYFRLGNPAGYVLHEKPSKFGQSFFITAGPLIIGTILALILFMFSKILLIDSILGGISFWLGISIAMNSFPSSGDARGLWHETNSHIKDNLLAIIGYPFAIIIFIANILRIIWFDLLYAAGLYYLVMYL